jgi:probable blue pigment (indigoidine) exporter
VTIRLRDLLTLTLAAACWGLGTVLSKRAIDEIAPVALLPLQLAASVVILALLMRVSGVRLSGALPVLARLGILNPGIAYALGLIGLTYISASMAVLLWALEPLLILLLAGLFLGEGVTPRLIGLVVVAAAGMSLVVFEPSIGGQWPGVVLTLVGIGCCAAYTVITRRFVGASDSTAQVVLAQQAYALGFAALVAVSAAVLGNPLMSATPSVPGVAAAAVSGALYYAAAYWFYLSALRRVPATIASTSFYLIPVFGLGASWVLLGDRFGPVQWLGVGIVTVAIGAIARGAMLVTDAESAFPGQSVWRDEPAQHAAARLGADDQIDARQGALLHR